ncbi:hypothetical protein GA0070624_5478 [Micromonospora rhizosphaerae]|uniref:Uncharacterized protein n=1 Tax=Micromonospora rhizosphaerae TaxID=568872 RepID=A0A1C6T2X0_9ACTN|nr:hypothetical protein GA0070624_5478 [Micromonospora rhizosphaerae]
MGARVVTVNEVLDGHVALDIQCLDRVYLNAYVPKLQTSFQVVAFLSGHRGFPFPSPALFNQIGQRLRRAVASYAEANDIPWVRFGKDDDKLAVMRPHLARQAATGRSGVAACGCRKPRPCRSCSMFILVQDAAEAVTSADVEVCDPVWIGERFGQWMEWSGVRDAPMGAVGVVMPLVFVQGV